MGVINVKLVKKIKNTLFSQELTNQNRLLNFILLAVIITITPTTFITYLNDKKVISLWAYFFVIISLAVALWVVNVKKKAQLVGILVSLSVNVIAMPSLFLGSGGIHSGMPVWIVLCVIFTWLVVNGKACYILLTFNIISTYVCFKIQMLFPEKAIPMSTEKAIFTDIFQSIIFVSTVIGTIYKYQSYTYERQNKMLLDKEKQLLATMKELEDANKAKRNFLANMSHEIRTPINGILGMNEITLMESKDPEILKRAGNIDSSCKALLSLVNDILDFSKIEAGKLTIIPDEYELFSLIGDSINVVSMRAKNKNLELIVKNNEEIPSILYGDKGRVRQCVVNLLTNAIKYTEKGSVELKFDFEKINEEEILLKVSVKDTGQGISEENKEKLFGYFNRINEKENRNIEGTGLGLAITQNLINQMGGNINLESEVGKGSEFFFSIPQKVISYDKIGDFNLRHKDEVQNIDVKAINYIAPSAKVLCVDDVFMNREVIRLILERTKVQLDSAENGEEALKLLKENVYDILLFDHMMPGMDGVELLRELKKLENNPNSAVPVIVLTANAINGAYEEYISMGFDDYLAKPVDIGSIDDIMVKYLPKDKIVFS